MHTLRVLSIALCLVAAGLAASSCGSTATSPSSTTANLAGTWTGTLTDGISGTGNLKMVMTQSGISLTGTWEALYSVAAKNQTGSLTGTVSGSSVSLMLKPSSASTCQGKIIATASGSSFSGMYSAVNCSVTDTGSMSATKQ